MEVTDALDSNYSSEIPLSEEVKDYLSETAKWAKFISIVGFIFAGLMVLISLFLGIFMGSIGSDFGDAAMPFPSSLISIIYFIMALVMVIPILYLYRFANNMQIALRRNNNRALTDSFKNLKSHYKFYGIFMAVILGLYALMFVVGIIGGAGLFM